jgi:hypothetical protein
MAQKVILTCDAHGDDTKADETVLFAVGNNSYEIELCKTHAKKFHDALSPFVAASRKLNSAGRKPSATRRPAPSGGRRSGRRSAGGGSADLSAVREWARANGYQVSERGRVSSTVLEAYAARG